MLSTPPMPLVFITGASSGIGQALARHYHRAGFALALSSRRPQALQTWAEALGLGPERCGIYGADVAEADSIVAAGRACLVRQGVPDVVIASAGISVGVDTAMQADLATMRQTFETNNLGMAATFHPFIDAMVRRGSGSLVGLASVAGIRGLPGHGAYCASKAGVISYCESLRGELRATGVKVTTICPGYIDTPLTQQNRYAMPFLMAPDKFAAKAFAVIEAGASYSVIPWQMAVVAKLLRVLPDAMLDRALAGRPRKHRAAPD